MRAPRAFQQLTCRTSRATVGAENGAIGAPTSDANLLQLSTARPRRRKLEKAVEHPEGRLLRKPRDRSASRSVVDVGTPPALGRIAMQTLRAFAATAVAFALELLFALGERGVVAAIGVDLPGALSLLAAWDDDDTADAPGHKEPFVISVRALRLD